jgi:hypothetical protein
MKTFKSLSILPIFIIFLTLNSISKTQAQTNNIGTTCFQIDTIKTIPESIKEEKEIAELLFIAINNYRKNTNIQTLVFDSTIQFELMCSSKNMCIRGTAISPKPIFNIDTTSYAKNRNQNRHFKLTNQRILELKTPANIINKETKEDIIQDFISTWKRSKQYTDIILNDNFNKGAISVFSIEKDIYISCENNQSQNQTRESFVTKYKYYYAALNCADL